MEPALFQFLIGVIGGSALGLGLVRTRMITSILAACSQTVMLRSAITIPSPLEGLAKMQPVDPVPVAATVATAQTPAKPPVLTFTQTPPSEPNPEPVLYHACPACGLQAPEKLMREHLMGSPLHNSPPSPSELSTVSVKRETIVDEESAGSSLGEMLHTLNVMERLLKRDFYRHELRVRSGIGGRVSNIG